jgi:hypothetical protein
MFHIHMLKLVQAHIHSSRVLSPYILDTDFYLILLVLDRERRDDASLASFYRIKKDILLNRFFFLASLDGTNAISMQD